MEFFWAAAWFTVRIWSGRSKEACEFIAPVSAYPGEFEMEAMASGAERVLDGVERSKKYTGVCSFTGFDFA